MDLYTFGPCPPDLDATAVDGRARELLDRVVLALAAERAAVRALEQQVARTGTDHARELSRLWTVIQALGQIIVDAKLIEVNELNARLQATLAAAATADAPRDGSDPRPYR